MNLNRFIEAQKHDYDIALSEIKNGKKESDWMWYIFPQIKGLGRSPISQKYAIQSKEEAKAYLEHPVLGARLREITTELLKLKESDPRKVMGSPDHHKLKSCMTLFNVVDTGENKIFRKALEKFYKGEEDGRTLAKLKIRR